MIKERLHALEVVVGSNHQFPGLTKPPHRLGKGICRIPVEACEWLIKQIDIRLLGPCPRKKSALLLPTRKRRNLPVGKILQITNSQCLDNCRIIRRALRTSPAFFGSKVTPCARDANSASAASAMSSASSTSPRRWRFTPPEDSPRSE